MEIPATIGRFTVLDVIGTGAFSAVYRARDERLDAEVAIKVLADHHSLDPDIRDRFIAEGRLLRRVRSPHVVAMLELDETERRQPFLVLEHVGGGNLRAFRQALVGAGRDVRVDDLVTVADGLAAALRVLHAERIVHRDLSPGNLLVRRGGGARAVGSPLEPGDVLVVADLGLSKDLAASSGLTAAAGTDGFAAPEQLESGVVDERADVYAASAVLVWLALGRRPDAAGAADLARAGWPPELANALAAGLATRPDDRPPTIVAWHRAVVDAVRPPLPPHPAREPDVERADVAPVGRSRWWGAVGAALLAVAGGGIGLGVATIVDDGSDEPAVQSTQLDDGERTRFERSDGGLTAAFEGPSTLRVGERATFIADTEGVATWVWLDASGQVVPDSSRLVVRPTSAGSLTLRLVVVAASGATTEVSAAVPVEPADTGSTSPD